MRRGLVAAALLLALAAWLSVACAGGVSQDDLEALESKVDALEAEVAALEGQVGTLEAGILADSMEIEKVTKTMVWAMDEGDMDTWLSIFSDDIKYSAYNYGDETPLLPIPIESKAMLEMMAPMMIFERAEHTFSTLSNMQIEVSGDTATAQDYYVHYEFPINPLTQEVSEERAYVEGMHYYKLAKVDGDWKITELKAVTYRKDALLEEMEELMRQALQP